MREIITFADILQNIECFLQDHLLVKQSARVTIHQYVKDKQCVS